ncbi:MAG TPA: hypothetical protein PKN34_13220, partial [Azospira sp.]|nr:hypothetical protein [Azospira sp.]
MRIGVSIDPWWVGVAILDKGKGALEDFVFSRFQLYSNVWSHKGVAAGKFLLSKAIDETLQDSEVRATVKTALTNIDQFGYFTEDFFWEAFRNRARTEPNSIAARLLQRKLPRHVSSLESPTTFEIEQHLADLRRRNPNVFYYKTHIRFSKIRH